MAPSDDIFVDTSQSKVERGAKNVPRWPRRAAAGGFLAFALVVVILGYLSQPAGDPFAVGPWWQSWSGLISRLPHPHHHAMPVGPVGSQRGFVPRGLELDVPAAARRSGSKDPTKFLLRRLAVLPSAPVAAAVGADGRVLLRQGTESWTAVDLPRPRARIRTTSALDRPIAQLRGHEGPVTSVAFSPRWTAASDRLRRRHRTHLGCRRGHCDYRPQRSQGDNLCRYLQPGWTAARDRVGRRHRAHLGCRERRGDRGSPRPRRAGL